MEMDALAEKARAGDASAERQLFEKLHERFRYLAKRKVGEESCEDLAQEACATVFEKYRNETFTVGFLPWAHGVLRMKIGNYLQRKRRMAGREDELGEETDFRAGAAVDPDLKRFLLECLRELVRSARQYARILNLSYHGYGTEEICGRLGIKANHYYVALSRGRTRLQRCLQGKGVSA